VSRSLSRSEAVVLGLVVVALLGLAGAGLFVLGDRAGWGSDRFHVVAAFPDVGGVEVGSRVRLQGMDAGEVEAVTPPDQPGQRVRLTLRISGKYRPLVGSDARVQIVNENFLAGKVVRILPGAAGAPPVADGGELAALVEPDLLDGLAQAATKLNTVLTDVDQAMQAFRKKEGDAGSTAETLAAAARKLNVVLAKAEKTLDGVERGEGTLGRLVKDEQLYHELTETLTQAKAALYEVRNGEGTLGKLVKNNDVYSETMSSLKDVRRMVTSVKQNSDAIKALPVVRNYVVDPAKELVRPDCQRLRKWYAEKDLFEPGRAVLTEGGKQRLDEAAGWLNEHKEPGSDLVIAAFAAPGQDPDYAHALTQKQSEVVTEYLRGQHRVQRTGWWWWSNRNVRPVGCGAAPSPVPEVEALPAARVELLVFVPPGS
jgi:phospholipid/cholesterol/gamma-HCH transport system substrate-binding protein